MGAIELITGPSTANVTRDSAQRGNQTPNPVTEIGVQTIQVGGEERELADLIRPLLDRVQQIDDNEQRADSERMVICLCFFAIGLSGLLYLIVRLAHINITGYSPDEGVG